MYLKQLQAFVFQMKNKDNYSQGSIMFLKMLACYDACWHYIYMQEFKICITFNLSNEMELKFYIMTYFSFLKICGLQYD